MTIRVETVPCATCKGMQEIAVGIDNKLNPILQKCPACGGRGMVTTYYQYPDEIKPIPEELLLWVIPWRNL